MVFLLISFRSIRPRLEIHTLFLIARNRSLTLPPLYFRYLFNDPVNALSALEYQSLPTTSTALASSATMGGSGGSALRISKRSDASHRNASRLAGVQKKGCTRQSPVSGLLISAVPAAPLRVCAVHDDLGESMLDRKQRSIDKLTYRLVGSKLSRSPIKALASTPSSPNISS